MLGLEHSKRARIIDAALETIGQQGFAGMSVRHLAVLAGLSPGSVYHHFSSKQELLSELLFQSQARRMERGAAVVSGQPPQVALMALVDVLWMDIQDDPHRVALRQEARHLDPDDQVSYLAGEAKIAHLLEQVLKAGARSGCFELDDAGTLSRAVISLIEHFAMCEGSSREYLKTLVNKLVCPSRPV